MGMVKPHFSTFYPFAVTIFFKKIFKTLQEAGTRQRAHHVTRSDIYNDFWLCVVRWCDLTSSSIVSPFDRVIDPDRSMYHCISKSATPRYHDRLYLARAARKKSSSLLYTANNNQRQCIHVSWQNVNEGFHATMQGARKRYMLTWHICYSILNFDHIVISYCCCLFNLWFPLLQKRIYRNAWFFNCDGSITSSLYSA